MSDSVIKSLQNHNLGFLCGNQLCPGEATIKYDHQEVHQDDKARTIDIYTRGLGFANILTNPTFKLFHHLKLTADYFAGEFVYSTKDKKFMAEIGQIGTTLIEKGYFSEVYIAYSEDYRELERLAIEKYNKEVLQKYQMAKENNQEAAPPALKDGYDRRNFPFCNLRIYVREHITDPTQPRKYRSVLSNVGGLELDVEKLVCFSASGYEYYIGGIDIWTQCFAGGEAFTNAFATSLKTTICKVNDIESYNKEARSLKNFNNILAKYNTSTGNENNYQPVELFKREYALSVLKDNKAWFDERAAYYGMYGKNLGEKKERVTVGENVMDFKLIDNIQMKLLINLKSSFQMLKDNGEGIPEDFEIMTNQMEVMAGMYNLPQGQGENGQQQKQGGQPINNGY